MPLCIYFFKHSFAYNKHFQRPHGDHKRHSSVTLSTLLRCLGCSSVKLWRYKRLLQPKIDTSGGLKTLKILTLDDFLDYFHLQFNNPEYINIPDTYPYYFPVLRGNFLIYCHRPLQTLYNKEVFIRGMLDTSISCNLVRCATNYTLVYLQLRHCITTWQLWQFNNKYNKRFHTQSDNMPRYLELSMTYCFIDLLYSLFKRFSKYCMI